VLSNPLIIALLAIAALLGVVLAFSIVPAIIVRRRSDARLRKRVKGKLCLSYDDGPGEGLTPALIELLARHDAKATFFLVGFRVRRWPHVCDQLVAAGHELGSHTENHKNALKVSPWRAVHEIGEGYRTMSRWMAPNAPFRPPFGKMTTWTWLATRRRHAPVVWWTIDGGDTHPKLPSVDEIAQRVLCENGGVVLLHSHDRGEDRSEFVLILTERLLQLALERRWEVCTVSRLC